MIKNHAFPTHFQITTNLNLIALSNFDNGIPLSSCNFFTEFCFLEETYRAQANQCNLSP